jgi:hypothetical protein
MIFKKPLILLVMLPAILAMAADTRADISNAAVLFLRIAAGARAAGMGEAFVAIADDATASHWNPAGLGAYPLAETWVEANIPARYRPLKAVAALRTGDGSDYTNYELWAISDEGLLRYDNRDWTMGEEFGTRSDETVRSKVAAYFSLSDDEQLDKVVLKVAESNSRWKLSELESFVERVRALVPADYNRAGDVLSGLDSLLAYYPECRLNWERVEDARSKFNDGMKDSSLTEMEMDRVNYAIEQSRTRFLPEHLFIPYAAIMTGTPTSIASVESGVLIGTEEELLYYNGRRWLLVTEESGLPSRHIHCLKETDGGVLVGTDSGLVLYDGVTLVGVMALGTDTGLVSYDGVVYDSLTEGQLLPAGPVTAMGEAGKNKIFAVVNNDLYHYDGVTWSNSFEYQAQLDDTPRAIATRFSLYGSDEEKSSFLERVQTLNAEITDPDQALAAGSIIRVPFVAMLKGSIRDIYVGAGQRLWLGSDHGVLQFTGTEWSLLGYRDHIVAEGETIESIAGQRSFRTEDQRQRYMKQLRLVNGIADDVEPTVGTALKVYRDPRASEVYDINAWEFHIYVATESGMLETDGTTWGRAELKGLGDAEARGVHTQESEVWFVTDDQVVTRARGRSEFALMHVNWLPELANDLYYEYFGFATGVEGWGTFGGNVTFISYGSFQRTGENSPVVIGEFESYDVAVTGSYGTSLSAKMKAGISAKLIYSRLADQGAGAEVGSGTSTGFAVDLGLLYQWTPRLNLGLALTNIGPKMAYIDAAQSDDLPRNLAVGFAYKVLNSQYNRLLITAEANKLMVGLDDGFSNELKEVVFNGGAEFSYANLIAVRGGYIYDEEGNVKTVTFGAGLRPLDWLKADFAYIPSSDDVALANTLRISLAILP